MSLYTHYGNVDWWLRLVRGSDWLPMTSEPEVRHPPPTCSMDPYLPFHIMGPKFLSLTGPTANEEFCHCNVTVDGS